jgi:hypothetical protein
MFFKFSRWTRLGAGAALCAAVLAGCGLKIGERPNQDTTVQLGSAETACLSGAAKTLADYLRGNTTENQITGVFNCASNSLKLFRERTRGSRPNVYSPGELRKFLERYFLRDFTISDALLSESMELKKTLLGGSTSELTVEELERLRSLLLTLRDLTIRLRPFLPLTPEHVSQLKTSELEDTISELKKAANDLGKILEETATPYEFSHLERLLSEVEKFLQDDDSIHETAEFRKYLPFFISIKRIVVSPDTRQMAGKDWRILLTRSADLYGAYLRSSHLLNSEPTLISGSGRSRLMSVLKDVFDSLRDIVVSNPESTVTFCSMNSVIDEASKLYGYQHDLDSLKSTSFQDLPSHLKIHFTNEARQDDEDYLWYFKYGDVRVYRGTIKQLLLPLIQKFLKPAPSSNSLSHPEALLSEYWNACQNPGNAAGSPKGLRPENLGRLWDLVERISEGQDFLERTYYYAKDHFDVPGNALSEQSPASLMAWLTADSFEHSLDILYQVPHGSLQSVTIDSARILSQMIETHLPLFRENDFQIRFDKLSPVASGQIARWDQSFVGLSVLHALWQVVHLTWDAYIPEPARIEGEKSDGQNGGISLSELRVFYEDVRELGVALKLFDPGSTTAADNRFLEGNLFTYASNGDSYMSLAEGSDLVSFLFSSKGLSTQTYNLVHAQCSKWTEGCASIDPRSGKSCHIGEKDVYGMDTVSTECFNHFAMGTYYEQLWKHMPGLSSYYSSLPVLGNAVTEKDRVYQETFACLVETVARAAGANPYWIGSGDIDQITALEHYLEAMFVRFDADFSGTLGRPEALSAYPVLRDVISAEVKKRVSFLKTDEDFQAVLTYILAKGTIPSKQDWKSVIDFGIWRYIRESKFEATRSRIVQVMATITGTDVSGCFSNPKTLPLKPKKQPLSELH